MKQLTLLREKALKNFKASLAVEGSNEYDALAEVRQGIAFRDYSNEVGG